jgi:hypothetical protein
VWDSLPWIAIAANYSAGQMDAGCILDNLRAAAGADSSVHPLISIDTSHLADAATVMFWL